MVGGGKTREDKIAHGEDIFRKVKDLQVGGLRRREREENKREKGKGRDSVELIDLSEVEERGRRRDAPSLPEVLTDARCCSPIAITCASDLHVPHC